MEALRVAHATALQECRSTTASECAAEIESLRSALEAARTEVAASSSTLQVKDGVISRMVDEVTRMSSEIAQLRAYRTSSGAGAPPPSSESVVADSGGIGDGDDAYEYGSAGRDPGTGTSGVGVGVGVGGGQPIPAAVAASGGAHVPKQVDFAVDDSGLEVLYAMGQQSLEPMGVVAHDAAMPTMQVMQDER